MRLRVRALTLGALLAEAGRALASLAGGGAGPMGSWQEVVVRAPDREALLVDWLNELIFRAEARRELATEFEILEATERLVRARVRGPTVAESPALVKAATLHGVRVAATTEGVEADVILDV